MVLHKAVAIMKRNASAGALAFKIGSEDDPRYPLPEHWWHPVSLSRGHDQFFYSDWFPEGAVFFRASALAATNGYEEELVHGFECVDLALRLLDHGFDIIYSPSLTCIETRVRGRHYVTSSRMNYICLRNRLWTAWKDLPAHRAVWYSLSRIIASALRAIRHGWLRSWFEAVHDGVVAPQRIRDKRHPIAPSTWKRIRMIRAGRYCPNPALPA
jgi:GT2 family glycosyltransferase